MNDVHSLADALAEFTHDSKLMQSQMKHEVTQREIAFLIPGSYQRCRFRPYVLLSHYSFKFDAYQFVCILIYLDFMH